MTRGGEFDLRLHHGGYTMIIPLVKYVGGKVSISIEDPEKMLWVELRDLLGEIGYKTSHYVYVEANKKDETRHGDGHETGHIDEHEVEDTHWRTDDHEVENVDFDDDVDYLPVKESKYEDSTNGELESEKDSDEYVVGMQKRRTLRRQMAANNTMRQ
ncbi:hypothetical protein CRG98_013124 [Punica granatum]|uniref:Uncharacterized protein n=1 Tax=Punica granatum TaxID=22663 RepID=A0A2I0KD73_PUNGR|nr:hypothetical protein CRG98_013124 [Punica granatum]